MVALSQYPRHFRGFVLYEAILLNFVGFLGLGAGFKRAVVKRNLNFLLIGLTLYSAKELGSDELLVHGFVIALKGLNLLFGIQIEASLDKIIVIPLFITALIPRQDGLTIILSRLASI